MRQYDGRGWFAGVIRRLCAERGVPVRGSFGDWLMRLGEGEGGPAIFGTDFGLNSSVAAALCKDKAAASALLTEAGVPAVPHALILPPRLPGYVGDEGSLDRALSLFADWGEDVVAKPNEGTGGRDVRRLRSRRALEAYLVAHLAEERARVALSPFRTVAHETRVVLLDGEPLIAYRKEAPGVTGDGRRSVLDLALGAGAAPAEVLAEAAEAGQDLGRVPAAGESVTLGWRFNLSAGGAPRLLAQVEAAPAVDLAARAAAVFGLRLAVVDLLDGGEVMEVNTGLYMRGLARALPDGEAVVAGVYGRVLDALLGAAVRSPSSSG